MDRENVKKALPILQAIAEGKSIQWRDPGDYHSEYESINVEELNEYQIINYSEDYRIKPEPKYRPFKDTKECWAEMQKHQPFGWIKTDSGYEPIWHVNECDDFNATFEYSTFADGTPFGVKEE